MSYFGQHDHSLEISRGNVANQKTVDKWGTAPSAILTTTTDFWSYAGTQAVWLAPTAARIHTIASSSAQDASGGTGTTEIDVYYLADWNTAEAIETVTGDFGAGVAMSNAAVMINRMVCKPQASSTSPNTGNITATAATDGTITAYIAAGVGQTQQAIYGWPSVQNLYLTMIGGSINNNTGGTRANVTLHYYPDVTTAITVEAHKFDFTLQNYGASAHEILFRPYYKLEGPGIIKMSGIANTAGIDGSAYMYGILVTE